MTSVIEARHRLDKTLASPSLSDTAIISNLVRKQLLESSAAISATDEVVSRKSNQLLKLLNALRSAKGERTTKVVDGEWKVKQDTPRFRVMYREGPEGAPYHSLCLDGIIDGPLSHALCVGCEVPEYKAWWPQFNAPVFKITESRWLKRDTVGGDYSVLRFKVPWPFAMREVILSAFELEYFDEGFVAVLYNSAPEAPDEKVDGINNEQIPPLPSHAVRMDLDGGFVLQKIGHNCSFFRIVVDLDMKLDLVPPWLINFIARQLVGHGYKLYQKAVTGVKGSILEKLANSDPMYKRLQAFDDMSSEPTLVPMSPSEKGTEGGFHKGSYKQNEIDSVESTRKSQSDDVFMSFDITSEDIFFGEMQDTLAPLSQSNPPPISNGLAPISNGNHDSNMDGFEPIAETNDVEAATVSREPEELSGPHFEEDGHSDPEVVWALEVLERFISHFNSQSAAAQSSESKDIMVDVQNGHANNSASVSSTAGGKECRRPPRGESDEAERAESKNKAILLPEDQQIIAHPRKHHGGFRFFRFRRRHKDKEEKSSKRR